jgi:voltage-gated potassium channel
VVASVTLTTVGYGDVTSITVFGRRTDVIVMILGIVLVALPAGMLASRFSEELHHRRSECRKRVDLALQDGSLEEYKMVGLKAAQREHILSDDAVNQIVTEESKRKRQVYET